MYDPEVNEEEKAWAWQKLRDNLMRLRMKDDGVWYYTIKEGIEELIGCFQLEIEDLHKQIEDLQKINELLTAAQTGVDNRKKKM